jgi:ribosomal-protein-alanine N-acetyltransferase
VVGWARSSGCERLWASVWQWNAASRRVLEKVGFTETRREETSYGINLITSRRI